MKPVIALNFKTYREATGEKAVELAEIAAGVSLLTGVRIIVCVQAVDLRAVSRICNDVYGQHADWQEQGQTTGAVTPEALKDAGAKGSLVNHSERRIAHREEIEKIIGRMKALKLETMVCAHDDEEAEKLAVLGPTFVAVEPPELIGTGRSVSTAKPEVVRNAVVRVKNANAKVIPVCGAGISNAQDVRKAVELGAEGVLLASAYVKSSNPKKLLEEMCAVL